MRVKRLIIRISDGLGNQLFEYALGKYLSDKLGCEMVFDKSHFLVSKNRTFQLNKFVGPAKVSQWGKLKELIFLLLWAGKVKLGEKFFRAVLSFLNMGWLPVKDPFRLQSDFNDESLALLKGTIYISGQTIKPSDLNKKNIHSSNLLEEKALKYSTSEDYIHGPEYVVMLYNLYRLGSLEGRVVISNFIFIRN